MKGKDGPDPTIGAWRKSVIQLFIMSNHSPIHTPATTTTSTWTLSRKVIYDIAAAASTRRERLSYPLGNFVGTAENIKATLLSVLELQCHPRPNIEVRIEGHDVIVDVALSPGLVVVTRSGRPQFYIRELGKTLSLSRDNVARHRSLRESGRAVRRYRNSQTGWPGTSFEEQQT